MKLVSRLYEMTKTLSQVQRIPSHCESDLETRLILICKPHRLERRKLRRSKNEYNLAGREKKARQVYLEVLETFPLMFLPFILVYSPTSCSNLKDGELQKLLEGQEGIRPGDKIIAILKTIANRRALCQSNEYKKLRDSLFSIANKLASRPKPSALNETDNNCICDAAGLEKIPMFLNEDFYRAIMNSPKRAREMEARLLKTTHCIRMKFARHNLQDAVIQMDIGYDNEIIKTLYPKAWEVFISTHGIDTDQSTLQSYQYDNACFTFQGASVSNISKVLGHHIYRAIEASQLREWEVNNFLLKTTDCIVLDICRSQPYAGVMHVRVDSSYGVFIASRIYSI